MITGGRIAFFGADGLQFNFLQRIMESSLHLGGLAGCNQLFTTTLHTDFGNLSVFVLRKNNVGACATIGNAIDANHARLSEGFELWCNYRMTTSVFNDHEAFSLQR